MNLVGNWFWAVVKAFYIKAKIARIESCLYGFVRRNKYAYFVSSFFFVSILLKRTLIVWLVLLRQRLYFRFLFSVTKILGFSFHRKGIICVVRFWQVWEMKSDIGALWLIGFVSGRDETDWVGTSAEDHYSLLPYEMIFSQPFFPIIFVRRLGLGAIKHL